MLTTGTHGEAGTCAADGAWVAGGSRATDDARGVVGAWAMVGMYECAAKGCCCLWNGVLMAAMLSWSVSWCHCSTVDSEVCGGGGLLSSCRASTSVASAAAAEGGVAAVPIVHPTFYNAWSGGYTMT
jgi:hypothetical protein